MLLEVLNPFRLKCLIVTFLLTPLLMTFLATPMIVKNEQTKVIMYVQWQQKDQPKTTCTWPTLKLLEPPGPPTALASKPGSGNTWVRHLLQLATGIQTGSIFHEQRLKRNGFPGEGINDGSVLVIKTHNLQQ